MAIGGKAQAMHGGEPGMASFWEPCCQVKETTLKHLGHYTCTFMVCASPDVSCGLYPWEAEAQREGARGNKEGETERARICCFIPIKTHNSDNGWRSKLETRIPIRSPVWVTHSVTQASTTVFQGLHIELTGVLIRGIIVLIDILTARLSTLLHNTIYLFYCKTGWQRGRER